MTFDELNLSEEVLQGIRATGFTTLTAVQEAALPIALLGKDVAAQAQTGTGKTAAFLITLFNRIKPMPEAMPGRAPRALIIAPTRELAVQILEDAKTLGQFTGLSCLAVYGGVDYQKQKEGLEAGVDILIGTPGRLIDYFKQKVFSLKYLEAMIIDEADRMFDMGFIADIRYMLRRMPPFDQRQSMLFSATLSFRVMELAYEHMNNPQKIDITPEHMTVDRIEQALFHVGRNEKFSLLLGILLKEQVKRGMLFVNTKREAERVVDRLNRNGFPADVISGDIQQTKRLRILTDFKEGKLPILVATDVASRGLHVDGVTHVFNYDLPQDAEDYVHRIGRTARAGASGKAYSFADETYVFSLEEIEKYIGNKIPVTWPDEDMFVKERRRTQEERRADEEKERLRRQDYAEKMARRGGGGGRGGSGGDGRGPRGPRPEGGRPPRPADRPRPAAQPKPAANPIPSVNPDSPESAEAKKKRRRPRKKKPAGAPQAEKPE
ncbi:MAG: DEAD/DEAH box helicase [Nitrospirae bacterium]|nr:DEAD/DEAH box helicase [Nitrospirota bacterium]